MRSIGLLLALLTFSACAGYPAPPPQPPPITADALAAAVDARLEAIHREKPLSGVVHVEADGAVLYHRAFGLADRARERTPTVETSFRVGSVTKHMTAAAILRLADAGRLRLDETLAEVLPNYRGPNPTATVRQLLDHTAGLPSYTEVQAIMTARDEAHSPERLMAATATAPPRFAPGSAWAYSNSHYIALGQMIEARSGVGYAEYMQTMFDEAGLGQTQVGDAPEAPDRAVGYRVEGGEILHAHPIHMSVPWAAGAVRSTVSDLVAWDRALRQGAVLSAAAQEAWLTPSSHSSPYGPYACGWIVDERADATAYWHGGGIDGFTSFFARVPEDALTVVVWQNGSQAAAATLGLPILDAIYPR